MGLTIQEIERLAYQAGTPWPDIAKAQIAELQETVAAQTALLNQLIDRIEHLELTVHRYINNEDGHASKDFR